MNGKFLLPISRHLLSTQGHVRSGWSSSQRCGKRKIFSVHHCAVCNTFKASVTITLTLRGNLNPPTNFTFLLWSDSCNCVLHMIIRIVIPLQKILTSFATVQGSNAITIPVVLLHITVQVLCSHVYEVKKKTLPFPRTMSWIVPGEKEPWGRREKERDRQKKKKRSPWRKSLWCCHNRLKASTNNRRHSQHRKLNCFIQSPKPN